MTHFELFQLPPQYQLDVADLQRRYRQLQQTLHPDRFARAGEREKLRAVQHSAQLNDAYQTLRKPLTRAEYVLSLRGVDIRHEQQTIGDPEFLMAQMEWRERIEEVRNSEHLISELNQAEVDLKAQTQTLQNELETLLAEDNETANEQAADTIRKLKFMHKLNDELERLADQNL